VPEYSSDMTGRGGEGVCGATQSVLLPLVADVVLVAADSLSLVFSSPMVVA
jgi:hypothetical protein